ncbi:MAG TPA: ABC transporter permease subunit, partial [Stellaceae bacterium]|nr:ABC transporter permease subunit [Stellaceae bacterium]
MTSRRNTGALAIQAAVLIVLGAVLWFAASNAIANLTRLGINTGFGFLRRPAGFAISQTLIPYSESSTYLTALAVAALNTVLLAALSIALATPIGFMIGLGRRSANGLLRSVSTGYVELLRNVPLLLQLFFWYFALLRPLPPPRQSLTLLGTVALNARGLFLPVPAATEGFVAVPVALLVGIVLAAIAAWLIARRRERRGDAPRTLPIVLALALGPAALAALATGAPFHWDVPRL